MHDAGGYTPLPLPPSHQQLSNVASPVTCGSWHGVKRRRHAEECGGAREEVSSGPGEVEQVVGLVADVTACCSQTDGNGLTIIANQSLGTSLTRASTDT